MHIIAVKSPSLLAEKMTKTMQSFTTMQDQYASLLDRYIAGIIQALPPSPLAPRSYRIDAALLSISPQDLVRGMKHHHPEKSWIIYDTSTAFIAIYDPVTSSAKDVAAHYMIQGGGAPSFVQGKFTTLPDICA